MPSTSVVSLIHNDYKYDNVVLDSSDVTSIIGVLDWEMCTIGALFQISALHWPIGWMPRIQRSCSKIAGDPQPIPAALQGKNSYSTTREKRGAMLPRSLSISLSRVSNLRVIVQQIYFRYARPDQRRALCIHAERIQILLRAALHGAQTGQI